VADLLAQEVVHLEILGATAVTAAAVVVEHLELLQLKGATAVMALFIYTTKEIKWEHMQ
jgi:hypothetical protein